MLRPARNDVRRVRPA